MKYPRPGMELTPDLMSRERGTHYIFVVARPVPRIILGSRDEDLVDSVPNSAISLVGLANSDCSLKRFLGNRDEFTADRVLLYRCINGEERSDRKEAGEGARTTSPMRNVLDVSP